MGLTGLHDRSYRFPQIIQHTWTVPILGVNICPHVFLVKLAYRETFFKAKIALKQWESYVHLSHLVFNDERIRLTTYIDMTQDNDFTLPLMFPHLQWDMRLSTHHLSYEYWKYGSKSFSHLQMTMDAQIDQIAINSKFSLQCLPNLRLDAYNN